MNTEELDALLTKLRDEQRKERHIAELADQVSEIHYSTDLGYGDEGEGFDFVEQVRLLIAAGWIPPEVEE